MGSAKGEVQRRQDVLQGFLLKPRTRRAVEALALQQRWSKRAVVMWLQEQIRDGSVIKSGIGFSALYQFLPYPEAHVRVFESIYPEWLHCCKLPPYRNRIVRLDGNTLYLEYPNDPEETAGN